MISAVSRGKSNNNYYNLQILNKHEYVAKKEI